MDNKLDNDTRISSLKDFDARRIADTLTGTINRACARVTIHFGMRGYSDNIKGMIRGTWASPSGSGRAKEVSTAFDAFREDLARASVHYR